MKGRSPKITRTTKRKGGAFLKSKGEAQSQYERQCSGTHLIAAESRGVVAVT
jgi:hypothetical protein